MQQGQRHAGLLLNEMPKRTGPGHLCWEKDIFNESLQRSGDAEAAAQILAAPHPGAAKALGCQVRGFDEQRWAEHRFEGVVAGNMAKFGQHPQLRDFLAGTGSRVLVEASPQDRVWGVGLVADDERAVSPARWPGLNLLGFALMEVRQQLRP